MLELKQARRAACFLVLSASVGLVACSSSSGDSPDSGAAGSTDDTGDGSVGCSAYPGIQTFELNLTNKGDKGKLTFVISSATPNPPAAKMNNQWTLKVEDASGQPMKDAVVSFPLLDGKTANPWMPQHGHGQLDAKAASNGDGTFNISPLDFFMSGVWQLTVSATSGTTTDSTMFTICVN